MSFDITTQVGDWLSTLCTREVLSQHMTSRAEVLPGLSGMLVEDAVEKLWSAWSRIFLPSEQHLDLGIKFLARARSFHFKRYADGRAYERSRYEGIDAMGLTPHELWCLTGLAGVTKTSFLAALQRACIVLSGGMDALRPTAMGVNSPICPVLHLRIQPKQKPDEVLRALANPIFVAGRSNIKWPDLVSHLKDWMHARMASLILVDELQFLSRSESASTLIANFIAQVADIGLPTIYCCNYSSVHKLKARPQEDKDRLLTHPFVMQQPIEGDSHWTAVVSEFKAVVPDLIDIDPHRDAAELYRLCGGLCRLLRLLLVAACRVAWPDTVCRKVTMADVRAAYLSRFYSSQRKDVEDLKALMFSAETRKRRRDLVCPFEDLTLPAQPSTASTMPSIGKKPLHPALAYQIESSISAGGREVLAELRAAADTVASGRKASAKVTRLPRQPKVTAEALLKGMQTIRDRSKPSEKNG